MRILRAAALLLLMLMMGSTASCGDRAAAQSPTAQVVATVTTSATLAPRRTPTSRPTATATPLPPTPPDEPTVAAGTVSGSVRWVPDQAQPFTTEIELRGAESFTLIQSRRTDPDGAFQFQGLEPAAYELWTLISAENTVPPGCNDVVVEEGLFRIGIQFGGDRALTSDNPSAADAARLISFIDSPDLVASGIYAVTDVTLGPGIGTSVEIILYCK